MPGRKRLKAPVGSLLQAARRASSSLGAHAIELAARALGTPGDAFRYAQRTQR